MQPDDEVTQDMRDALAEAVAEGFATCEPDIIARALLHTLKANEAWSEEFMRVFNEGLPDGAIRQRH